MSLVVPFEKRSDHSGFGGDFGFGENDDDDLVFVLEIKDFEFQAGLGDFFTIAVCFSRLLPKLL